MASYPQHRNKVHSCRHTTWTIFVPTSHDGDRNKGGLVVSPRSWLWSTCTMPCPDPTSLPTDGPLIPCLSFLLFLVFIFLPAFSSALSARRSKSWATTILVVLRQALAYLAPCSRLQVEAALRYASFLSLSSNASFGRHQKGFTSESSSSRGDLSLAPGQLATLPEISICSFPCLANARIPIVTFASSIMPPIMGLSMKDPCEPAVHVVLPLSSVFDLITLQSLGDCCG